MQDAYLHVVNMSTKNPFVPQESVGQSLPRLHHNGHLELLDGEMGTYFTAFVVMAVQKVDVSWS